jgi:tetratricopeptide (TPR) repeat protein
MRPHLALVVLTFGLTIAAASAAPSVDPRELQAREAFATGKYDRALELFGKLYAETLHPTYLRNIGRCYQYLGDPDHALNSFRDYLRTAKGLQPDERHEVEGFMEEMEALKRRREQEARPTPGPQRVITAPPPPSPQRLVTGPAVTGRPDAAPPPPSRWWIWALGGALLAGTAVALGASGVFTRTDRPACPGDRVCP